MSDNGNRICELRKARGWSMRELGERVGAHFSTINKLEKSNRKLTAEWAARLALALDVSVEEIGDAGTFNVGLARSMHNLANGTSQHEGRGIEAARTRPTSIEATVLLTVEIKTDAVPDVVIVNGVRFERVDRNGGTA